jgi:uncharacterized protein
MTVQSLRTQGEFETLALRLLPGADVRQVLETFAKREQIRAGVIMGAVGSLSQVQLRFADAQTSTEIAGKHEILTLSGMVSEEGVHVHMSVANSRGDCKGGHLMMGCLVNTTLEIAIALLPMMHFRREFDPATGYPELKILPAEHQ